MVVACSWRFLRRPEGQSDGDAQRYGAAKAEQPEGIAGTLDLWGNVGHGHLLEAGPEAVIALRISAGDW